MTNKTKEAARIAKNTAIVAGQMHAYSIERAASAFRYAATHDAPEAHHVTKFLGALLAIANVTSAAHGI
jgi:hypothetical protein